MRRIACAVLWTVAVPSVVICAFSVACLGADVSDWLNAEAWKLVYEVTFTSSSKGTINSSFVAAVGTFNYTLDVEQSFSATLPLDMRSPGASLSMTKLAMAGAAADPTATMDLIMKTDRMSSWMHSGGTMDENASADAQMAAMKAHLDALKGPGKVQYVRIDIGHDIINEMGSKYDVTTRTTKIGSGKVSPPSEVVMFEIDAETGRYLLSLPYGFGDDSMTSLQQKTVTQITMDGNVSTDSTLHQTSMPNGIGQIVIDEPSILVGSMPLFEGPLDLSVGKIVGERTVKAHFVEGVENVPGTLVFKYTLTMR